MSGRALGTGSPLVRALDPVRLRPRISARLQDLTRVTRERLEAGPRALVEGGRTTPRWGPGAAAAAGAQLRAFEGNGKGDLAVPAEEVTRMRSDREPAPTEDRLPCRPTDRVEDVVAWILTAAALVLVVAAGITGFAVHGRELGRAEAESATRYPTNAVLLEDAPLLVGYGERIPVRAAARWTDRTGAEHTGVVVTLPAMPAGSVVAVWLDEEGRVVDEPIGASDAVVLAVAAAGAVLTIGGAFLYALWTAVRSFTAAANDRRWEQEWERVEPEWRDRHRR